MHSDADPTQGQVDYIGKSEAESAGLIKIEDGKAIMRVDTSDIGDGENRKSVRLHSATSYETDSLIVTDISHMPVGCAVWPAWWSNGPNWPDGGEM